MHNNFTTNVLKTMNPGELEDYRARGEDFPRELAHAVMSGLNLPKQWDRNGEYHNEFGGFYPVQVRFTPTHGKFHLALCNPGDIIPVWMVAFIATRGRPFSAGLTMQTFSLDLINHGLSLVDCLNADEYSTASIISILAMEGAS